MRRVLIFILVACMSTSVLADYRKLNKKGNEAYSKRDIEQALKYYQEAEIEKPQEPVLEYNIGTALFEQAKYEDAVKRYSKALHTDDPAFQADAYYNLGSSFFRNERYAEAINAYQKCLELKPDDVDAKYNLELSRKKLKEQAQQQQSQKQDQQQQNEDQKDEQQQQQQQQGDDQQKQDQQGENDQNQQDQQQQGEQGESGEDQQNQQQQQQQGEGEQEKKDQGQQQQGSEGKEEQQQGKGQDEKMSKEDADRILKAIGNSEKDLQKKINRTKVKYGNYDSKNDW